MLLISKGIRSSLETSVLKLSSHHHRRSFSSEDEFLASYTVLLKSGEPSVHLFLMRIQYLSSERGISPEGFVLSFTLTFSCVQEVVIFITLATSNVTSY